MKHRPPLGPCRPLDQAPAVEIGRGLWSAAPSSSSGGHGSAARRRAGSSASARRPSRIPETFLELSPSVLGERVCWPEETAPRRPASCLDLERCVPPAVSPSTPPPPPPGAAATASRAARLTLRACRGRHAAQGSVRREASRRAAASGLGSICFLLGDASWWRRGLWGREPGPRGRQQSTPRGARRSSCVRGRTGA